MSGLGGSPGSRHERMLRHDEDMRAALKSLDLEPDPATLSGDPSEFALLARMYIGSPDGPGMESFDITVCTPEWLAKQCVAVGGVYNARHHLVVTLETFDKRSLHKVARGAGGSRSRRNVVRGG